MSLEPAASVVDLVVLGMLLDSPMNPYALAKVTAERELGKLVKISTPAVYKSCRRLAEAGHLNGKAVRDTEAPERIVYSVSRSGRKHFGQLMHVYSSTLNAFHFEFNSFIWNLSLVDHADGLKMLRRLQHEFIATHAWLVKHEKRMTGSASFGSRMVVKQYRMVLATLVQWAAETVDAFTHEAGASKP